MPAPSLFWRARLPTSAPQAAPRGPTERQISLMSEIPTWHGTTIVTVRKGGNVVIGGDGQVSIGPTVIK